jgi:hypothetical protein
MIAQPLVDAATIRADQLTEGDIIRHFTGEAWKVICEPEYTNEGIRFEVLYLDLECPHNTQSLCFAPELQFELLDYQPVMAM